MPAINIPCADCEQRSATLVEDGFVVHGCTPIAARPGFCTLSYGYPPSVAAPAAAGTHAIAAAAALSQRGAVVAAAEPLAAAAAANAADLALTPTQIRTAQAIVNIFETSQVRGNYGQVTIIEGDTGRLTYGRSQTTLGSGNLVKMLTRYCDNPAARFGKLLRRWLPDLEQKLAAVDEDQLLHNVLRTCADDLVMREVQDAFFDQTYWRPAFNSARTLGIRLPLGVAIVYDSTVHGSWQRMRDRTNDSVGQLQDIGELPWLAAYLKVRRNWLATHSRSDLRATVYRMDALQRLLDLGHTGLALPLVVRGIEISTASLAAPSPSYFDGPAAGSRTLSVQSPLLRGHDVRRVQLGLSMDGMEIVADGVYGPTSALRIRQYQLGRGYAPTGVAMPELIAELVG